MVSPSVFPSGLPGRKLISAILGAVLIALFAQLRFEIPWNEAGIPVSGQSFAVLLVGYLLPRPWGVISILLYLSAGAIGLPVFAGAASGTGVFLKGSGGYLFGFAAAAWLMGEWKARVREEGFGILLLAMVCGTLVILLFGLGWLSHLYGYSKALEYGLYPFLPGAVLKAIAGAAVIRFLYAGKGRL